MKHNKTSIALLLLAITVLPVSAIEFSSYSRVSKNGGVTERDKSDQSKIKVTDVDLSLIIK